ncbi:helix-turn-helix domain-containing protein [Planctomycetota bacterium]
MPKPVAQWDEAYVTQSLPLGEHDWLERKGSRLFDDENKLRNALAKELSALANSGGGQLVCGVGDKTGEVEEGGIASELHNGTREWLMNIVPNLTAEPLTAFCVYEIRRDPTADTKLDEGKALFVIDVQHSERRPHQCGYNGVYYVRVGGNSWPMPHALVVDMINRKTHPCLQVVELGVVRMGAIDAAPPPTHDESSFQLRPRVRNMGRVSAVHWALELSLPDCLGLRLHRPQVRFEPYGAWKAAYSPNPERKSFLAQAEAPLYPGQDFVFGSIGFHLHSRNAAAIRTENPDVQWRVFAESAEPASGSQMLMDSEVVKFVVRALLGEA